MSDTTSFKFTCYHCSSENRYPALKMENNTESDDENTATENTKPQERVSVLKRCMICATPNKIELPEGYTGESDMIFRGLK